MQYKQRDSKLRTTVCKYIREIIISLPDKAIYAKEAIYTASLYGPRGVPNSCSDCHWTLWFCRL